MITLPIYTSDLKSFLDELVELYECQRFIENDPISIPHGYTKKQDIEISGLFASIFAWGLRKTIINKSKELMSLMDNAPHQFILHSNTLDLKILKKFKHRTFQFDDLLYFIHFLKFHYSQNQSLETAFLPIDLKPCSAPDLNSFHSYFFSLEHLPRTKKHVSNPLSGSTCKRICMYLRWMVRSNAKGVDFGIWKQIKPENLNIPLDVHVHRVAVKLGLLTENQRNWNAVLELTGKLKSLDSSDPVKYDFALFNLSVKNRLPL